MSLQIHGVEDRNPFDFEHVIVIGGKEQMLAQSDPDGRGVLKHVAAHFDYEQEAFALASEPGRVEWATVLQQSI